MIYYLFNLCIFLTTDQKVTGLNPVGVTLLISHLPSISVTVLFFQRNHIIIQCHFT